NINMSGFDQRAPAWDFNSLASTATEHLNLTAHLAEVPAHGSFVDVGSGPGCGLGAVAYLTRPDLKVISIDPGFGLPTTAQKMLEGRRRDMMEQGEFDEAELATLEATDAWYADQRAGYAEELPIDSGSIDLMASYAAIPEHSADASKALRECLRTLKVGGL